MPAMKRHGKPDTGNPFVRFDEGRSGSVGLTTAVSLNRLLPLRLLYPVRSGSQKLLAFEFLQSPRKPGNLWPF
jgi:hypothetical protein